MRLLGGIAFRLRSPSSIAQNLQRRYVDIDFVGLRNQRKEITQLFTDLGYAPRTAFNAMQGFTRLIFNDLENERRVDIFLNVFEMCHKFDFTNRLKLDSPTLPLADLLLTKLQVIEITEREYKDVTALLKDHDLGSDSKELIDSKYIAKLCSEDWGLWKTITLNLDRINSALDTYLSNPSERQVVANRISALRQTIDAEPKSMGWKLRAKIGEKKRWYELPEMDKEVIDSRPVGERGKLAS